MRPRPGGSGPYQQRGTDRDLRSVAGGVEGDVTAHYRPSGTGESLGDRFRRLLDRLSLSQSALAHVLGLSPPMLSQLMSGQRAKITNPAVLNRLLAVEELARDSALATLNADEIGKRLSRIHDESATTTTGIRVASTPPAPDGRSPAQALQTLLRIAASAAEIEAAAARLLAELLRVYGNGRTPEAEAHFARTVGPTP